MDILVPVIALGIGIFTGVVVYRHATKNQIESPRLWGYLVGGTFFLAPILLKPYLTSVYYALFIPRDSTLVLIVEPLHALATIIGGGALVGLGTLVLYFEYSIHLAPEHASE